MCSISSARTIPAGISNSGPAIAASKSISCAPTASCNGITMATDSPYGRRDFLKDSVVSVAKAAKEFNTRQEIVPERPAPAPVRTDWLRPPGAADEALFLERCTQCGDCAKVCPYGSITFHPQNGTPVIFADQTPCYLCEDVPCIAACATEALLPVEGRGQIRMGLASVSHRVCTAGQGCHACASKSEEHTSELQSQ